MLKVAMITRDYPPKRGGISTHVSALELALGRLGIEVSVMAGFSDLRTLLIPLSKGLGGYDLVHVQSSPYGAFVFGKPMIITVHAPILVEWKHYNLAGKLKSIPALVFEKMGFRKTKMLLSVSDLTKRNLIESYGVTDDKVRVIGNGVDYPTFAHPREIRPVTNRVLLVSRLEKRKNVGEALRAFGKLQPNQYEARIVGDGSERRALEELAKRVGAKVSFLGWVQQKELAQTYRGADIFVTTSLSEGFGLSLLEAMASGCAVLASRIPTHEEIIHDGVDGLLYSTLPELTSKLETLVSNPKTVHELGTSASERARQFSWDSVAARVASAYTDCLPPTVHGEKRTQTSQASA